MHLTNSLRSSCALYLLAASLALFGCSKKPDETPQKASPTAARQQTANTESAITPLVLPDYMQALPFKSVATHPGTLAISADGNVAAHIEPDGMIVVWDAHSFSVLERIATAIYNRPSALALNADGNLLAIGCFDSTLIIRSRNDANAKTEADTERRLEGQSGAISALAFSPNGKLLASGSDNASTFVWDMGTGHRLHTFDSELSETWVGSRGGVPVGLGFSGDTRTLLVNEWYSRHYDVGRASTLWDLDEGIEIGTRSVTPPGSDNMMRSGQAIGANNWLLAYTSYDGLAMERLDSCGKERIAGPASTKPTGSYAETVAADTQGRWVAALKGNGERQLLKLYTTSGNTAPLSLELPVRPIALIPHPDGKTLFVLAVGAIRHNGNEYFIVGRDAETVTAATLFAITLPEELQEWPALATTPDASRCPPTAAARQQWSYRLPATAPTLPVLAKLKPPLGILDHKNEPEEQKQTNPPSDIYFADDGSLHVLHHAESNLPSAIVVWDPAAKRVLRSHFQPYAKSTIFRLHQRWAARKNNSQLVDLLTGQSLLDEIVQKEPYPLIPIATDSETGEVYRLVNGQVERYDTDATPLPLTTRQGIHAVTATAYNSNLFVLYNDGSGELLDTRTKKSRPFKIGLQRFGTDHPNLIDLCEFNDNESMLSANGQFLEITLACGSGDSPTQYPIFDLRNSTEITNGPLLGPFPKHSSRVVVPDARLNQIDVWDLAKNELLARLPRQPGIGQNNNGYYQPLLATLSDEGLLLASASPGGLLRVWNLDAKHMIGEATVGSSITTLVFNASGQSLAVGTESGDVWMFDTTGRPATQPKSE